MISIKFNPENEMMEICKDSECVFSGNYWDFKREPVALESFLKRCGLEVECYETEEELV